MSKRSMRGLFLLILGVTFIGFLFSVFYTIRHGKYLLILPFGKPAEIIPTGCACISEKTGNKYNFCYKNPQNSSVIGKRFDCQHLKILEKFDLVEDVGSFVDLEDLSKNEEDVVFVSAISDNHFNEAVESLSSLRKFYPNRKYIMYGMELSNSNAKYFKTLRNVEYRVFNTSEYPKYVNNWFEYRFKPLILAEVMKEYANIWWMDAHINVKKPNMTKVLFEEIAVGKSMNKLPSSIILFIPTSHSNFAVLFPELLNYFPTNSIDLLKSEQRGAQLGANTFYVARTEYTQKIFKWWVLCALDQTCMSPPEANIFCHFSENRFDTFARCFRFDQSVLNLLLLNDFQDYHKFYSQQVIAF
uniref:Uncharacterized protein n=1 Tax=Caenorhabditis japonica TaxID=281687 RepID=A0A8R1E5R8_CAEJA